MLQIILQIISDLLGLIKLLIIEKPFVFLMLIALTIYKAYSLFFKKKVFKPKNNLPYKKKKFFFTVNEKRFYKVLIQASTELDLVLFSKVRIADLLYVTTKENWRTHFNKISQKHVDFVLLDKKNLSPILLIELDDPSHNRKDRIERDMFVDDAYENAGMNILHIKTAKSYDKNELKSKIANALPRHIA